MGKMVCPNTWLPGHKASIGESLLDLHVESWYLLSYYDNYLANKHDCRSFKKKNIKEDKNEVIFITCTCIESDLNDKIM